MRGGELRMVPRGRSALFRGQFPHPDAESAGDDHGDYANPEWNHDVPSKQNLRMSDEAKNMPETKQREDHAGDTQTCLLCIHLDENLADNRAEKASGCFRKYDVNFAWSAG